MIGSRDSSCKFQNNIAARDSMQTKERFKNLGACQSMMSGGGATRRSRNYSERTETWKNNGSTSNPGTCSCSALKLGLLCVKLSHNPIFHATYLVHIHRRESSPLGSPEASGAGALPE